MQEFRIRIISAQEIRDRNRSSSCGSGQVKVGGTHKKTTNVMSSGFHSSKPKKEREQRTPKGYGSANTSADKDKPTQHSFKHRDGDVSDTYSC